jgi:hypothetical protein
MGRASSGQTYGSGAHYFGGIGVEVDSQFWSEVTLRCCSTNCGEVPSEWYIRYKSDVPRLVAEIRLMQMERRYMSINAKQKSIVATVPKPAVTSMPSAGYIVALRYPTGICEPFSDFSRRISDHVPCIRYDEQNAHTTLATYRETSLADFQPDQQVLDGLNRAVARIASDVWLRVLIEFPSWVLTEDAAIVFGYPVSYDFWQIAFQLVCAGKWEGLDLNMPWGAHMTAARFTKVRDGAVVRNLRRMLHQGPALHNARPSFIDVGWYQCSSAGFMIHRVNRHHRN